MDDTRAARAADSEPGRNPQFDRGWGEPCVTGPDVPAAPAHSYTWRPDVIERRQEALRRARPAVRAAEAAYQRLVDSNRATGLRQRGERV